MSMQTWGLGGLVISGAVMHNRIDWVKCPPLVDYMSSAARLHMTAQLAGGFTMPRHKGHRTNNGITQWLCSRCKQWFPEAGFYYDKRTSNGLKSQCRTCHTEGNLRTRNRENTRRINRKYYRSARAQNPAKFQLRERLASRRRGYTKEVRCRTLLNNAVRDGRIQRPDCCSMCEEKGRVEGHHSDYNQPLQVLWLCPLCHARQDRLEAVDASSEA